MSQQSFMATLFTVMRKEWRDFVRDRRTFLLTLLVAPLMYPVLFLGIGKRTQMRAETQLEKNLDMLKFKCWYYEKAMEDGNEDEIHAMLPDKLPADIQALYDNSHDRNNA